MSSETHASGQHSAAGDSGHEFLAEDDCSLETGAAAGAEAVAVAWLSRVTLLS